MKLEPAQDLLQRLTLSYNKDPRDWHFSVGRGHEGRSFDILISHSEEAWQIKLDSIFKLNPIGVGARIGQIDNEIPKNPYSFGFRPLSEDILNRLHESESPHKMFDEILKKKPVSTQKFNAPVIVQGPIEYAGSLPSLRTLNFVSEKHQTLDIKLKKELERLMIKSNTLVPYI